GRLQLPNVSPLIIEGAGGLMVPLTNDLLFVDQFKVWNLPVLLACRSSLGTINHTLLSIEALRKRDIPILGCVLIGDINLENERAIEMFGNVRSVGRIPKLETQNKNVFRNVFEEHFQSLKNILQIDPIP
ncbi:MAG TPA: AAA family ATPase, partial [Candidatus Kapabacteria bacterium]